MAYTIEYSSSFYARRSRRYLIAYGIFLIFVFLGLFLYIRLEEAANRPTYTDIVHYGTTTRSDIHIPSLQSSADRAFETYAAWRDLEQSYLALAPYLRLERVPVTIPAALQGAATGLSGGTVKSLLLPQQFRIFYSDSEDDWVGTAASRPLKLIAEAEWKTRRAYLPEEGDSIINAVTNLFGASLPGKFIPELTLFEFKSDGKAAERVLVRFAFPSLIPLPVSSELANVVRSLYALHDEVESISLDKKSTLPGDNSLLTVKTILGNHLRSKDALYRKSLDPGRWLMEKFPVSGGYYGSGTNTANEIFNLWTAASEARFPWQRKTMHKIVFGRNYINHRTLVSFLDEIPSAEDLNDTRRALLASCASLTNAIDALYFEGFDPAPASRDTLHATENLFTRARDTGLFPTNRISPKALESAESLTVSFPTRYHSSPIRISDDIIANASGSQFVFAPWKYEYTATNAPVELADVSKGLKSIFNSGFGYMPDSVTFGFYQDKIAVIRISGLVPLRQKISTLKAGAQ